MELGFHQENAIQIFNIFQRLHGRADYEGTGIGLAMC
jgi:light-regulated signal transduction histidine kinase (bacteriophytochrome)